MSGKNACHARARVIFIMIQMVQMDIEILGLLDGFNSCYLSCCRSLDAHSLPHHS